MFNDSLEQLRLKFKLKERNTLHIIGEEKYWGGAYISWVSAKK